MYLRLIINRVTKAMKSFLNKRTLLVSACIAIGVSTATAIPPKRSPLNNDPEVVYMEEYTAKEIEFITTEALAVYSSKKGASSRKLTTFKAGSKVKLIALTDKAYRVSGQGKNGKTLGWVNPKKLASKDPNFVENLKKVYQRQMVVNALLANNEVAIGMTLSEVKLSLGEPTKKTSKVTKDGRSGKWEFIEFEEIKHYNYVTDRRTGQIYKTLSHITTEEKSNITVEFENTVVTAITRVEDNGPDKIKIITPPIILGF